MAKLPLLTLFLMAPVALAGMLGHAPPHVAVRDATDIAVGVVQVSRARGLQVRFTPQTVLKGNLQPGSTYVVDYTDERTRGNYPNVMPQIAAATEGKPAVMFLGRLQPDGRTLTPDSLEGAVWPRTTQSYAPHKTPDTLEECTLFVKALLANPKLKLKLVKERETLPDGHALPEENAVAAPPDDKMRALNHRPPAEAVRSATDIALGVVQVNHVNDAGKYHGNGLEISFTPQTIFKGGMQPGKTFVVDYPLGRQYFRDYLPQVAAAAEGKPVVILLGRLHSDGKTFEPEGLDSAVWPRSSKWGGVFQTPDTLEECITFIKALVEKPDLKLKIVDDRQMLPDGYTLPSATSGAIKSDAPSPATPKVP